MILAQKPVVVTAPILQLKIVLPYLIPKTISKALGIVSLHSKTCNH